MEQRRGRKEGCAVRFGIIYPRYAARGGAERMIATLAEYGRADIVLVTTEMGDSWELPPRVEVREVNYPSVGTSFLDNIARAVALGEFIEEHRKDFTDIDVWLIVTAGIADFAFPNVDQPVALLFCTPLRASAIDPRDERWVRASLRWRAPLLRPFRAWYVYHLRDVCRRAAGVACISRLVARRLSHVAPVSPRIIYPPVSFPSSVNHSEDVGDYIIYVSRFTRLKRQLELISAWRTLLSSGANVPYTLIIAGSPFNVHYTRAVMRAAAGVPQLEVHISPSDAWVDAIYRRAAAAVFAGFNEDFGIAPLESVVRGVPVVGAVPGGYTEPLHDVGGDGALIPVKDTLDPFSNTFVQRLADALFRLCDYPPYAERAAAQKCSRALQKLLAPPAFAARVEEWLSDVIHNAG